MAINQKSTINLINIVDRTIFNDTPKIAKK